MLIAIFYLKSNLSNVKYRFGLFALLSIVIILFAVLNLDVSFNYVALSDRYGYSASAFVYCAFAVFLFSFIRKLAPYILSVYLVLMIPLTIIEAKDWGKTGKFAYQSIQNFPELPAGSKYFLVNLADDYNGHVCLRDGFREAIFLYKGFTIKREDLIRVADVNVFSFEDETGVEKLGPLTYKVSSTRYGKWYRNHGKGMVDYEHKYYTCDVDDWNLSYVVNFKEPIKHAYLIKATGSDWIVVDSLF